MMILTSCVATPPAVISDHCIVDEPIQLSDMTINWFVANKSVPEVREDIGKIATHNRIYKDMC